MKPGNLAQLLRENILYKNNLLSEKQSSELFEKITKHASLEQKSIRIFGKEVLQPRLLAYYGDPGTDYKYSGKVVTPKPWFEELVRIKSKIEAELNLEFNSVLINYYRNGKDSMGSHQDNETELGETPFVASLSLGAIRKFRFRWVEDPKQKIDLDLENGSLLLMKPDCQKYFKHEIPKQLKVKEARINLSFRRILL